VQESLHVLPACVSPKVPTRLLDFCSGETGFYVYEMDDDSMRLAVRASKRNEPFFASFVEPWRISAFCDALIEEFELRPDGGELALFAGATGLHRDLLMSKRDGSEHAKNFLQEAQHALSGRLGGKPVKIWLFVPSGLLEAQLELCATEWLVGRARLCDDDSGDGGGGGAAGGSSNGGGAKGKEGVLPETLVRGVFQQLDRTGSGVLTREDMQRLMSHSPSGKADEAAGVADEPGGDPRGGQKMEEISFDDFESTLESSEGMQQAVQTLAFSGTLSVGSVSCQMAMMSGNSMPSLQLFTVPVGSRVPLVEGDFSKPVRPEELKTWRGRVRAELGRANFPRGLRGLFVGISVAFHAARAAGLADRIVGRNAALAGLQAALERLDPEDQHSAASLTLVHELLQWAFDEAACLLFKRRWVVGEEELAATWTLGLFTQQHRALVAEQAPHRRKQWRVNKERVLSASASLSTGSLRNSVGADNRLFEVPFVAWPLVPSYLLDIGSGELGVYVYEADLVRGLVKTTRQTKIQDPFYENFVVKNRVEDFAKLVVREFGIEPGPGPRHEVIAGGTTGLHREMLLSDPEKRDEIFKFIGKVEEELTLKLGRQTVMRIFVPSGELEAQFELRGVEWLIGQANIDVQVDVVDGWMVEKAFGYLTAADGGVSSDGVPSQATGVEIECMRARLKSLGIHEGEAHAALHRADANQSKTVDYGEFAAAVQEERTLQALVRRCCFCGTISAGGGSSQLTLTGCVRNSVAQMFSMPIGNRLPVVQRLFSTPVTWEERGDWVERIRDALRSGHFPQGVEGLFVGISAMYHAAKVAGITERIVPKREAMKAFADSLAKLDASDHRNIANLTLVQEIIRWVFDDDRTSFLFKRNWNANGTSYVAGWTLGWYVMQFEGDADVREKSVCDIQRISRGACVRQKLRRQ